MDTDRKPRRAAVALTLRWLAVLTLVAYPIAGLLASLTDVDSTVASYPFRLIVALCSAKLLLDFARTTRGWYRGRWLLLFWAIYGARLVWDWGVASVPGAGDALFFFLVAVLVPSLALLPAAPAFNERRTARLLLWVGAGICGAAVLMQQLQWGLNRALGDATGRLSFEAVNAITLGHVAVSTLIAALCLTRMRGGPLHWLWLASASALALACLVLSASRGPALALIVCTVAFAILTGRWRWLLLGLVIAPQLIGGDAEIGQRFIGIEQDESALERLLLQGNAIAQFIGNPLLGSAFVETEFLSYPHNLFIETAMALGVLGLLVLLIVLAQSARRALQAAREGQLLLPLLYLQYLLAAQFSGALYGHAAFWATTALLVGLAPAAGRLMRIRPQPPNPHIQFVQPSRSKTA